MSRALIEKMFTRVGGPMYISGNCTLKINRDPSEGRVYHRLSEIKINLRAFFLILETNESRIRTIQMGTLISDIHDCLILNVKGY